MSEQLWEQQSAAESVPQCVVCDAPTREECAICKQPICSHHARACEFCKVSETGPYPMPPIKFCSEHAIEVEDRMFICVEHKVDFELEMARLMAAERILEEVMV